ncbi:MAG: tetratricopeptide repeat protein [Massilia sp.]|nr:tetratricopeptide repeat protein [Massilia sp.]
MKRRLLPLLLAACCAPAFAGTPSLCKPIVTPRTPDLIAQAAGRRTDAQREPGAERLALADADAQLARAIMLQNGLADSGIDGGPVPRDLVREALDIWSQARPDPVLARQMRAQAIEFMNAHQCAFARSVLQAALAITDRTAGADSSDAVTIVQDALKVAAAADDAATLSALSPRRLAAMRTRTAPLDQTELAINEALIGIHYQRDETALAEEYVQRSLALLPQDASAPASTRRLKVRLAGIYYAQLRFAEAEALRAKLAKPYPHEYFEYERYTLTTQVRAGDLLGTLARAEALLTKYRQEWDKDQTDLAAAEQRLDQLRKTPDANKTAIPQATRATVTLRQRTQLAAVRTGRLQDYVGEILQGLGRLDEAAASCEAALATFGMTQFADWSDISTTKSDLAILQRMRGNTAQALALQDEVLKMLLPLLGPDHPDVQTAQSELAILRKK